MSEFITAIGLVFVIEGLLYAVVPDRMKSMMRVAEQIQPETMRNVGVIAIGVGVAIVWIARRWIS